MPVNHAAYLKEKGAQLEVAEAPYTEPGEGQVLVKTAAIAINPIDWKVQALGFAVKTWPAIIGCDISGPVESVGPGVLGFSQGDRVFGHCLGLGAGDYAHSAFQEYVLLDVPVLAKIPENISFEEAAGLPLGINTASAGLFEEDKLGLVTPPSRAGAGKALLVWGGSSSVGTCAIQLAAAAGYEVFAMASRRNHDLCTQLGASQVFDYNDGSLVENVVSALNGKEVVGAYDTISIESTVKACCEIIDRSGGRKMLVTTLAASAGAALPGFEVKSVFANTVAYNGIGAKVWGNFLPTALKDGSFKPGLEPVSAGKGLGAIETALGLNKKGVSGKKVVVSI